MSGQQFGTDVDAARPIHTRISSAARMIDDDSRHRHRRAMLHILRTVALARLLRRRETRSPRTVLGFYAAVVGLVLVSDVSAITALASTNVQTWLIPWLLAFAGVITSGLLVAVFIVSLKDPSRLLLGEVTGQEYAEIQQILLGDSRRGERLIPAVQTTSGPLLLDESEPENMQREASAGGAE